jgi:acyl carrier protein
MTDPLLDYVSTIRHKSKSAMTRSAFLQALEEILGVGRRTLREEDSRESIASWNSLADVQLFSLINSEFGIEPNEELIEAETVGDIFKVLENHGAF